MVGSRNGAKDSEQVPTDSDFHITKAGANNPHWEENSVEERVGENELPALFASTPAALAVHSFWNPWGQFIHGN